MSREGEREGERGRERESPIREHLFIAQRGQLIALEIESGLVQSLLRLNTPHGSYSCSDLRQLETLKSIVLPKYECAVL